uniref:Uncharacterized protein n=1 Tax=Oryza brachyantha TaxID=4533 RepID=J3M730_ORYBR
MTHILPLQTKCFFSVFYFLPRSVEFQGIYFLLRLCFVFHRVCSCDKFWIWIVLSRAMLAGCP